MRRTILILLLFLAGCSAGQWYDRMSTPEERALALKAATALQAGDYDALDLIIDPPLRDEVTPKAMAKLKLMVPKGPMMLKTIGVQNNPETYVFPTLKSFNYEVGRGDRWAIVQITLGLSPTRSAVAGYRVWPTDHAPSDASTLSLAAAGAIQYFWVLAMAVAVVVSLTGIVQVLRMRGLKLKWLWTIGCLFSFVNFQLNWVTGEWGIWPLSFTLLGASLMRPDPFSPAVAQFAIPVVAITFLILRATWARASYPGEDEETFT